MRGSHAPRSAVAPIPWRSYQRLARPLATGRTRRGAPLSSPKARAGGQCDGLLVRRLPPRACARSVVETGYLGGITSIARRRRVTKRKALPRYVPACGSLLPLPRFHVLLLSPVDPASSWNAKKSAIHSVLPADNELAHLASAPVPTRTTLAAGQGLHEFGRSHRVRHATLLGALSLLPTLPHPACLSI